MGCKNVGDVHDLTAKKKSSFNLVSIMYLPFAGAIKNYLKTRRVFHSATTRNAMPLILKFYTASGDVYVIVYVEIYFKHELRYKGDKVITSLFHGTSSIEYINDDEDTESRRPGNIIIPT